MCSNEYIQYTIFNMKRKKIAQNYSKSAAIIFFSKGLKNEFEIAVVNEPAVSVRATEVLLYCYINMAFIYPKHILKLINSEF